MDSMNDVPKEPGTYVLWLYIDEPRIIAVGRLGVENFAAGTYAYVGSAFGPGGLRARLRRHVGGSDTLHWHIDYVRAIAEVRAVWYCATGERLECRWSQTLAALVGTDVPMRGFGASDCDAGCDAHLIRLPVDVSLRDARDALAATVTGGQIRLVGFGISPDVSTIRDWLDQSD